MEPIFLKKLRIDFNHVVYLLPFFMSLLVGEKVVSASPHDFEPVVQAGHSKNILSSAVSDDERFILTGGADNAMKLWERSTGREIRSFYGHNGGVSDIAIVNGDNSEDRYALSSSRKDKAVILWNLNNGKKEKIFPHQHNIRAISVSPDNTFFLSAGDHSLISFWDLKTYNLVRTYNGPEGGINSLDLSKDGWRLALGGKRGEVWLIDLKSGQTIHRFTGHRKTVTSVKFSDDSALILSSSYDKTINIWDVSNGEQVKKIKYKTAVLDADFYRSNNQIVSVGKDKKINLQSIGGYSFLKEIPLTYTANSVSILSSGEGVLVGGRNRQLALWNLETDKIITSFQEHASAEYAISISSDGLSAISIASNGFLSLWDMSKGLLVRSFKAQDHLVSAFALSPDGTTAFLGSRNSKLELWDINDGALREEQLTQNLGAIESLDISPDNNKAIIGYSSHQAVLWDIYNEGESLIQLPNPGPVAVVEFSQDGKYVLTGAKNTLILWDVSTGNRTQIFQLSSLVLHASILDEDFIISISGDNKLEVWNRHTGRLEKTLGILEGYGHRLSVSPDRKYIVTGSKISPFNFNPIKTMRYWSVESGKELHDFQGYNQSVNDVSFFPNKNGIVAVTENSLKIYNGKTNELVARLSSSPEGESIIITPDAYFSTTAEGGKEIIWASRSNNETFSYQQLPDLFRNANVISDRLKGNLSSGKPSPKLTSPPTITIGNLKNNHRTKSDQIIVSGVVQGENPIEKILVSVNGRVVKETFVGKKYLEFSTTVPLINGRNRIQIIGVDTSNFSSNPVVVDVISEKKGKKKKLHVISIGVSEFENLSDKWQLDFPDDDAKKFSEVFSNEMRNSYDEVIRTTLINKDATTNNIQKLFEGLATDAEDLVVVLLAGHGVINELDGKFYFLLSNTPGAGDEITWDQLDGSGGLTWDDMSSYFSKAKGRVLLFLDACHSSKLTDTTFVNNNDLASALIDSKRGGITVFSASKGRQKSQEDSSSGYGLFTQALVQGITNRSKMADVDRNGYIEFIELVNYVTQSVSQKSKGKQTPWLSRKEVFGDFTLVRTENNR